MKKIITIILCSVCCNAIATAQGTYTLEQLKQLAVENNYNLRSARNAIQQSKEVQSEAFTKYFPQVSALGFGFQNNKPMIDYDIELPEALAAIVPEGLIPANISLMKKGVYGSVSAIQPVFMGGQIINGNKLAKVGVEASELQLEASEDQVELTTEQYYWQMVSLKEKQQTLKAVLDMLETLEKDVSNMVRVGAVNRNDLLQVQLRKGEVETAQLELENGLATVSQLLAQHIGKTGETIDVVSSATEAVPALPIALRQDHQSALAATPQYRLLEKNVESHRLQHKLKVGQNMPSVGVGASYSYNDFFEKSSSAMIFAAVQVPISGWWGGSHAIKRQKLALQDAQEQMEDNGQKLIIRMNNAWAAVETSHKKLLIAHDAIEQAEENLRLNRDYYRVGSTKMSDLLLAQQQYQLARDRYTDAFADFQTKQLEYRQATGQ
ncbi:MAG: TolC family protein [Prevotella sp.]|nr:TolC family protein [Prevotella sp.]